MTIKEQIKAVAWPFELASAYEGSCPCARFVLKDDEGTVYAHSRCWRVSDSDQDLYIWGKHPKIKSIAKALKKALDETKWYNPYTIKMEEFV